MISKRISAILLAIITANLLLGGNVFAADGIKRTAVKDVSGTEDFKDLNVVIDGGKTDTKASTGDKGILRNVKKAGVKAPEVKAAAAQVQVKESCDFNYPNDQVNSASLVAVRRQLKVDPGETFRIKVFLQNTGTWPWFSTNTQCPGVEKMSLGTDRDRDHNSVFYQDGLAGWEAPNRIGMDQTRVDPGQIASFTFWAKAGTSPDVYKEYFTPVIKDMQWLDGTPVYIDVIIGETGEDAGEVRQKIAFSRNSGSVMAFDLHAPKTLKVNLAEQKLYVYLGDTAVRDFRVSTGKYDTPTPVGHYGIILKQEVRVGFEPPHYVMPKYMMFQESGYGFHALPSLASDGNVFWTEALNHIGIPVSHGCVRLLPDDASWLFDFTDVGTKVEIVSG